jgi:short-subunit dehydrogenase
MSYQTVFVTGASSGLGRGLALHYARAGATVWAAARREERLSSLRAEVGNGGRIVPVPLDVRDLPALRAAIHAAEAECGGALDLVIANAGTGDPTHARNLDWDKVKRILDVNVTAAIGTLCAALPAMVARNRGTVAGISSLAAFRGLPGNAAYSASKAALHIFLESMRVDLVGTAVRAVCVYPGFVRTEMSAKVRHRMPFLMEIDDAVRAITRGLDSGRARIAFPFLMAAGVRLAAAMPDGLYTSLAGRMSRKPRRRSKSG